MMHEPGSIQPPATGLINHEQLLARLRALAALPRVWMGSAGRSHRGREIPYVVVAAPEVIDRLETHREKARKFFHPFLRHHTLQDVEGGQGAAGAPDRLPVLLVGASFGNEAAHTEALVEVVERLAAEDDPNTRAILDRVITVCIPLMNPDGRETALAEWTRYPRSPALSGSVNAQGSLLNRDFLWLTQPETRAVMAVYREWHPVAAYDPHEDMYILAVTRPQTCWTPPFARPIHPELHPAVIQAIDEMGHAIAASWWANNFDPLYDPEGNHGFMNLYRLAGRFHLTLGLHGTPAVITESARTPGSQCWEDRVRQKTVAAFAILRLVAERSESFLNACRSSRRLEATTDAYLVPRTGTPTEASDTLLRTLLQHEVSVYSIEEPFPAWVIPLRQPEARLTPSLLTCEGRNLVALPPALGVEVHRVRDLPAVGREALERTPLRPVHDDDIEPEQQAHSSGNPQARETLRVQGPIARGFAFVKDLGLNPPRIGVYLGQGADDRYLPMAGDVEAACRALGFDVARLHEDDVHLDVLASVDVFTIPGGDPEEVVQGWSSKHPWQRLPWETPGSPRGIGSEGLRAIRAFVIRGGLYVGLGVAGAALAGRGYADLADIEVIEHTLGEARVLVKVERPDHPLMRGVRAFKPGDVFEAYYYSEPQAGILGGPVLRPGSGVEVVATFAGLVDASGEAHLQTGSGFGPLRHAPAILHAPAGRGHVVLFAFAPAFRGRWHSTAALLGNAFFLPQVVTRSSRWEVW